MTKCDNTLKKVLESNPNMGALDQAVSEMSYNENLQASVVRAKKTGKYANPETRELFVIDKASKLIGKTLPLEEMDGGRFVDVYVETAKMIDKNRISVNDGEYVLDLANNMTSDGRYMLGSENGFDGEYIKLVELSGTVLQDVESYFEKTVEMDGNALSESHRNHLASILEGYKQILEEAGKDVEITAEFLKDLNEANNTRGEADPELAKMKLYLGNQKNNTMSEILAHELQHLLIKNAIKDNKQLAYDILKLRDLLRKEFVDKYGKGNGWQVFTEGKEDPDIEDAKKKWDYVFNNTKYPAEEFLAYASTNEQMVRAIGQVQDLTHLGIIGRVKETGKWTKLWNRVVDAINKAYRAHHLKGRKASDLVIDMLDVALKQSHKNTEVERKGKIDKMLDGVSKLDEKISKYTGVIDKEYKNIDEYAKKSDGKMNKLVASMWRIKGLAKARSWVLQNNVFSSVTRDTSNADIAKFYEMFRKSKAFVEKEVVAVKSKAAKLLDKGFKLEKMTKEAKRSAKRVLIDLDAQALGDIEDIRGYLKDSNRVNEDLDELTKDFDADTNYAIDRLAELLVTNKTNEKNGYVNASQIALGIIGTRDTEIVEKIDKAITLRALQLSSRNDINRLANAMEDAEIKEGLSKALELFKTDQDKVLKEAYFGDKMYMVKGAKQEQFKSDKKHYLVEEREMRELTKAGLSNLGKHEELSRILDKDIYTVVGDSVDVAYTEGLMSVIQLKNEGDSLKHLLMELGQMSEEEVEKKVTELTHETGATLGEALIPERSGNGDIYDYKVRLSYETKADFLDMNDDIVGTIAGTVANLTHKQEAMINNRASLRYLKDLHTNYKTSKEFKFIEISKDSKGKFKEYWDMLPFYMKREINKNMNGKLMVEESMLVDFFGYQDASIVNAPWVRNKKKRQLIAKKLEQSIQEITKRWKKVIVAFTPATITGNMTSNMIVAMQHTSYKNPVTYLEKFKDAWGMMNEYQEDRSKKIELELRRDAGENISQKRIDGLEAKMRNNPVSVIIEDGQYNAILEDIDTEYFDNKGMIEKKIDDTLAKIKKDKSREALKAFVDTMYLKKDSRLHDSVMKLTTYADATNKMVILLDSMEQNNGKVDQKTLNYLDQLHVNYGYLDNRYIKYANDLGFLTFTKYFFRVFPAMIKLLGNKAFTVMLTEGGRKTLDLGETPFEPFYTPIDSLTRKVSLWENPLDVFKDILVPPFIR